MVKTFAAAGLAVALALSPLAAFAETAMSDSTMSDKMAAPKKPMMKHHTAHKKTMTKPMSDSTMTKGGDMQPKM